MHWRWFEVLIKLVFNKQTLPTVNLSAAAAATAAKSSHNKQKLPPPHPDQIPKILETRFKKDPTNYPPRNHYTLQKILTRKNIEGIPQGQANGSISVSLTPHAFSLNHTHLLHRLLNPGLQRLRRPKLPKLQRDLQTGASNPLQHSHLPILRREVLQDDVGRRHVLRRQRPLPMQRRPLRRRLQELRGESPQFGAEAMRGGDRRESPAQWVLPAVRDLRVQAGEWGRVAVQGMRVNSGEWDRVRGQIGSGAGGNSERSGERWVLRRRLRVGVRVGSMRR